MTQQYTSAKTSLNQVPAIMKKIDWKPGQVNLDIGGGAYNTSTEYLRNNHHVVNLVYDPYNRDEYWNENVLAACSGYAPDSVTISNVLNVIKEEECRLETLRMAREKVRCGGMTYITVYEGDRSGEGRETSKGYQNNRKLRDYMQEVSKVFDCCYIVNGMIVAFMEER